MYPWTLPVTGRGKKAMFENRYDLNETVLCDAEAYARLRATINHTDPRIDAVDVRKALAEHTRRCRKRDRRREPPDPSLLNLIEEFGDPRRERERHMHKVACLGSFTATDYARTFGVVERTARDQIAKLLAEGVLVSDGFHVRQGRGVSSRVMQCFRVS